MSALDTMKSALLDAKTEAAALRIRVRQLEEKLVEVAAVGEREMEGLRDEVKQLRTSSGLWSGRVQELVEENTRLHTGEGHAGCDVQTCEIAAVASDEASAVAEADALNTPLKRRAALVEPLVRAALEYARTCLRGKDGNLLAHGNRAAAWARLCDVAEALFRDHAILGKQSPLSVDGTRSDNTSVSGQQEKP